MLTVRQTRITVTVAREGGWGGSFLFHRWCLTLRISSDDNRRSRWVHQPCTPFPRFPQLTICYLDMLMTSEERRKQLRDQYCFECDCVRCQTQDKVGGMRADWSILWWCLKGLGSTHRSKVHRSVEQGACCILHFLTRWDLRSMGLRRSWE